MKLQISYYEHICIAIQFFICIGVIRWVIIDINMHLYSVVIVYKNDIY